LSEQKNRRPLFERAKPKQLEPQPEKAPTAEQPRSAERADREPAKAPARRRHVREGKLFGARSDERVESRQVERKPSRPAPTAEPRRRAARVEPAKPAARPRHVREGRLFR